MNAPSGIELKAYYAGKVPVIELAKALASACKSAGFGDVIEYAITNQRENAAGGITDLLAALTKAKSKAQSFELGFGDKTFFSVVRRQYDDQPPTWDAWLSGPKSRSATWLHRAAKLAIAAAAIEGLDFASVARTRGGYEFVPEPPLARTNHVITCTEAEVAERYEDPAYFWTVWDKVEAVGDQRVCIRELETIDIYDWLAHTFERTMQLARLARPGLTYYEDPLEPPLAGMAAWWEPGDLDDELAGPRALELVGYDAKRKRVEYAGMIAGDRRHVLIREIHELRALVAAGELDDGRKVAEVHVVFPDAAMARQERRPLLDVGAKVFHLAPSGKLVELTD